LIKVIAGKFVGLKTERDDTYRKVAARKSAERLLIVKRAYAW
jgi:hypothetical protein